MREPPEEPLASDPNLERVTRTSLHAAVGRFLRTGLFTGLLLFASASPARADDEATTAVARERFKEGVQFFDQKLYDKARAAFLQAYALKRHPAVLLNLAQSELRSGHEADAANHFAQFLREAKEATDAERQSAEGGLNAAKAVITELTVNTDEDGALISVDGTTLGLTPLPSPVYLAPGAHSLSAKKEQREASVQFTAVAGQSTSTTLRLKKAGAATPAAEAAKPAPKPPESSKPAESAPAPISEEPATRERQPFLRWATHSPAAIVSEVIALGGAGVAIGGALAAQRSYDSANSVARQIRTAVAQDSSRLPAGAENGICARSDWQAQTGRAQQYAAACSKYQDRTKSGDKWKKVAIGGTVVAGVAAVATVVLYFTTGYESAPSAQDASKPRRAVARVVPWYTASEHGLFVVGEF